MIYSFDDAASSVTIRDPRLPQPWINYLSNGTLHAFVSQAGGGFAWWKSPLKNRLTRYRQYNLPIDSPGFYVYLREEDGTTWSPSWRPAETPLDAWSATHEPGLTRFVARRGSMEATLELLIPPDVNAMIWDLRVTNFETETRRIDVVGYVEFSLLDWRQDTDWACYVKHNIEVGFDAEANAVTYLYRHFHHNPQLAACPLVYFGTSGAVASFATDRDAFVGPYRDERHPAAVERNHCGDAATMCGDPCGALHSKVEIPSRGQHRLQFFLGGEERATIDWPRALHAVRSTMQTLRGQDAVDRHKASLRQWWDEHLGVVRFTLPDADIARQVNLWSPVQSVHTGRYSRSVSQHAAGVRTLGFRDTCQDMMAIAYRKPAWAAQMFLYLISQQYEDGHAPHQCNPSEQLPAEPRIHIDNPLWLPLLAHTIMAETGDLSLLQHEVPWLSAKDNVSPVGGASVWTHLLRIADFIEANLGQHGIPLIHHGDWNDAIGKFAKHGRGESVMAAQQYVLALRHLEELALLLGDTTSASRLAALRDKQESSLLACAWDGSWWRRGFDDNGHAIGSQTCEFGQIWLNSQSWAVLADVGSAAQQERAMDSVAGLLDTNLCGLRKLHPSFPSFPEAADPYSGYSPGCGENGAIFCHANAWAIMAEAKLGGAERAWQYYRQLVPHLALQRLGLDRYKAEPYAFVSNIIGPENPKYGWANVAQVTGTAAWMDIAATQWLLGVRPEMSGLRLAPCLPPDWRGFSAVRNFRGCRVEIDVHRADHESLTVEGAMLEGDLLPSWLLTGRNSLKVIRTVLAKP